MRRSDFKQVLRSFGQGIARAVFPAVLPATCAGCGVSGDWFCDICAGLLRHDARPGCQRCGRRGSRKRGCWQCATMFSERFVSLRACFAFDDPMRRAIHRFKYNGEYERGRDLGRRMNDRISALMPTFDCDVIVPVPLHQRRYRQRGFNQSRILASEISNETGIPIVDAVRRVKNTMPQTGLTSDARIVNLLNAFESTEDEYFRIKGSRVLVVDDVTTTGATIAGVAEALEDAGAAAIYAVTLAREQ